MAEYIDKERFLASMGLTGDETKYGNRDAEHQHRSYSTYMSYEIMGCVDDSIVEEELVPVVHGRWIDDGGLDEDGNGQYRCSQCGVGEKHNPTVTVSYCWNCGTKMDGGNENVE